MTSEDAVLETLYGRFAVSPVTDLNFYSRFVHGAYHQSEDIELLRQFLTSQSIAVDIGAHIGSVTIPLAMYSKQVYAFEPMPNTRSYLERNVALNRLDNVSVLPFALGNKNAEARMHVFNPEDAGQNVVSAEGEVPIRITRLDDHVKEAHILKIDTEGLEKEVLQGGMTLIRAFHPVILCEINFGQLWAHTSSPAEVEHILRTAGYTLYLPIGKNRLGVIWNLSLVTGLIFPAFFVGKYRNDAFDLLASLPKDIPQSVEVLSPLRTVWWVLRTKTRQNIIEHEQNIRRRFLRMLQIPNGS